MGRVEPPSSDTATRILDVAERLVEVRGFNGFSYADVSSEMKITKAALHYHFANKADLGVALIVRYTSRFEDALHAVETRTTDAPEMARPPSEPVLSTSRFGWWCALAKIRTANRAGAHEVRNLHCEAYRNFSAEQVALIFPRFARQRKMFMRA